MVDSVDLQIRKLLVVQMRRKEMGLMHSKMGLKAESLPRSWARDPQLPYSTKNGEKA